MRTPDDLLRRIGGRNIIDTPGVTNISGGVVGFSAPLPERKPKPKPTSGKGK